MNATVAQLVEYDLAKVGVAGSNPVCRSHGTGYACSFFSQNTVYIIKFVAERS